MDVGKMCMRVGHRFVPVWMGMWLAAVPRKVVAMLVMLVVAMPVVVV